MSDSTQLADQFLLQSSLKPDTLVKVSRGKSVTIVNGQSGSYSSGIVSFDCSSALNGAQSYASLKDAYIVPPYVVSMRNTAATALSAGDYPSRYAVGLKCNVATIVDEVKVYFGDGYVNNSVAGNSSLALVSGGLEPVRSNTGFARRVLNNPPEVAGLNNSYGWPSLNTTSSQAIAQMRGTGAFKKGTALTQGSALGEWFYMLKIRLVDLHPIFSELDLVGNPQLKLELKVQSGYTDLTLNPQLYCHGSHDGAKLNYVSRW
ncbi:unnamed protein product [Phytophthora lilii]|uniref:Unnamed protein product n=1 Tax=Phytophthora lilii TaxID=2077276 RepID=A0A9W6TY02_9STRA|nr:unnamed protein product [Phytophthora lilii]